MTFFERIYNRACRIHPNEYKGIEPLWYAICQEMELLESRLSALENKGVDE